MIYNGVLKISDRLFASSGCERILKKFPEKIAIINPERKRAITM